MKWPEGFDPESSPVFAHNEILIATTAERVWRWLIRAANWPAWYSNSSNIQFLSAPGPELAAGTEFRWKTFGATVTSRVMVFDPPRELGWDARGLLRAYHGWEIIPDDTGVRVVTEECQNGIVPMLAWWYLRPMLERGHQNWIDSLRLRAEASDPL
ncbi:MAG TPA: SRPBCC domain-containing protein [Candidatus Binataceae bacterium]|nr:SRPBCC domain-containing protein [Candidatus Binataceae bacterium]